MMCNRGQSAVEIETKGASLAEAPQRDFYTGVRQLLHPMISHDRQRIINIATLFGKAPITGLRLVRGLSITLGSHNGIS